MAPAKLILLTHREGGFYKGSQRVALKAYQRLAVYPLSPVPAGLLSFFKAHPIAAQGFVLASPLELMRDSTDSYTYTIVGNLETYDLLSNFPPDFPILNVPALVYDLPPELCKEVILASGLYRHIYPGGRSKEIARWPTAHNLAKELKITKKIFAKFLGLSENLLYYYLGQAARGHVVQTVSRVRKVRPKPLKRQQIKHPDQPQIYRANGRDRISNTDQLKLPIDLADAANGTQQ